jgi:hypothetical protein
MIVHGMYSQPQPNYSPQRAHLWVILGSEFYSRNGRVLLALNSPKPARVGLAACSLAGRQFAALENSAAVRLDTLNDIGHLELTVLLGVVS